MDPAVQEGDIECLYDLRRHNNIPDGQSVYVQSGDTSDFDGYLIAAAGQLLERRTPHLDFAIVVPERRACRDKEEPDTSKHDPSYSEEVLDTAGSLLRRLCPDAQLVRGPLNQRNLIPWRIMFNEPEEYGPLLDGRSPVDVQWTELESLAGHVMRPEVTSIIVDMNGSLGYLDALVKRLGPAGTEVLGRKLKASGMPVILMAGVQAEVVPQTLSLPGRDPRATTNANYYPDAVEHLLKLAKAHDLPLLFVTNNVCNHLLKFQDANELAASLGLKPGLLRGICDAWFGRPHLHGKCVPFDWVAFAVLLLYGRQPSAIKLAQHELWVGAADPSVLVLRNTSLPRTSAVDDNLQGTSLYGTVQCLTDADREALLSLARFTAANVSGNAAPGASA